MIHITRTDNTLRVAGTLNLHNATRLRRQGEQLIMDQAGTGTDLVLDLSRLQARSTLPLAVLLCWLRTSQQARLRLRLKNTPDWLTNLITMHNLHPLFQRSDTRP